MEAVTHVVYWALVANCVIGLVMPIAWWPRAVFLKRLTWAGRRIYLYKSLLPGAAACAMWAYGADVVIVDANWVDRANVEEMEHTFRHEAGHIVMGHTRFNTVLCAAGMWCLLPFFRRRQEAEADAFAVSCCDEKVIS